MAPPKTHFARRCAWGPIWTILLAVSPNLCALEFSRHNADSPQLNAIAATGEIVPGDAERLHQYISTLPEKARTAIYLGSPGGSLDEGLKLGYLFKRLHIRTVVEGDRPNNFCASSCALAFLGGHDADGKPWRSSTTDSRLGYHQFYCSDGIDVVKCDFSERTPEQATMSLVSKILQYGSDMNVPSEIFIKMFATKPDGDLHWFTSSELCSLGIRLWDNFNRKNLCN